MGASNPNGDSTISGLPAAQALLGSEVVPADQLQNGALVTVKIPLSSLVVAQPVVGVNYGTTAQRPAKPYVTQQYLDTTLGLPIWCKQATPSVIWVDAAGVSV
jgi:hypothetical protein